MVSSKVKAIIIVFALFLVTGIVTVGCKQKDSWVNTKSMPGNTFKEYRHTSANAKNDSSTVVYLGDDKNAPNVQFGPKDVSFNFRDLK